MRLYDTATRSIRDFTPIKKGEVGMYLCGATVQGSPHIGHIRSSMVFDVLRRYFEFNKYKVVLSSISVTFRTKITLYLLNSKYLRNTSKTILDLM